MRVRASASEGVRGQASDAARLILDEAGLPTYLMHVELEGTRARLVVDRPVQGAWRRMVIELDVGALVSSLDDAGRRRELARRVRRVLRSQSTLGDAA